MKNRLLRYIVYFKRGHSAYLALRAHTRPIHRITFSLISSLPKDVFSIVQSDVNYHQRTIRVTIHFFAVQF